MAERYGKIGTYGKVISEWGYNEGMHLGNDMMQMGVLKKGAL